MNPFIEFLDNLLIEINNSINEKIVGINYLEVIKVKLIEKLVVLDKNIMQDLKSELMNQGTLSKKQVFNNRPISYNINYYEKSASTIKQSIQKETLNIVLEGSKILSIFDKYKPNKSVKFTIIKNVGTVISHNTIISENTNKKSIILSITTE